MFTHAHARTNEYTTSRTREKTTPSRKTREKSGATSPARCRAVHCSIARPCVCVCVCTYSCFQGRVALSSRVAPERAIVLSIHLRGVLYYVIYYLLSPDSFNSPSHLPAVKIRYLREDGLQYIYTHTTRSLYVYISLSFPSFLSLANTSTLLSETRCRVCLSRYVIFSLPFDYHYISHFRPILRLFERGDGNNNCKTSIK